MLWLMIGYMNKASIYLKDAQTGFKTQSAPGQNQ